MTRNVDWHKLKAAASETTRRTMDALDGTTAPAAPVEKQSAGIRMPRRREPNKGEAEYGAALRVMFQRQARYEAITLRLPSGTRYTPDWTVFLPSGLLCVEVKGRYRLGSADASARAFKEAASAFPEIEFWHASKTESGQWNVTKANERKEGE